MPQGGKRTTLRYREDARPLGVVQNRGTATHFCVRLVSEKRPRPQAPGNAPAAFRAHDGWLTGGDGSGVLDAKLLVRRAKEFVELRLGGPDDLVLQHLYQPIDRGIADYGLEHPVYLF